MRIGARLAIARFRVRLAGLRPGGAGRQRQRHFDAFISYSHGRDGRIAVALQHALHRFARPWYRLRAMHVFRDDANLTANPNLWSSITAGLGTARFLVLLASPQAAASPWVNREVAHWLEHRPADRLLIVLTDGELHWDDARGDFDLERSDALPRSLAGAFQGEPRFVDLRFARDLEPLSMRNPEFRGAVADLAAAIHERPKDELVGEDVRQYRRTRRLAWGAGLTVLALAIAATVAAVLAVRERDRAEEQLRLAVSRFLAQEATGALEAQHSQAILLALESLEMSETPEARSLLYRALVARPQILRYVQSGAGAPADVSFSPDGESLAVRMDSGVVELLDADSGRRIGDPVRVAGDPIHAAAFSPEGDALAVGDESGAVHILDTESREGRAELSPPRYLGIPLALVFAGEDRVVAGYTGGAAVVWDLDSEEAVDELPVPIQGAVGALSYASDRDQLAVAAGGETVDVWDLGNSRRPVARLDVAPSYSADAVAFTPRGDKLAVGTTNGNVLLWDARRWTPLPAPNRLPDAVSDLAFSANGESLAVATYGKEVRLWNAREGEWERKPLPGHIGSVTALSFAPASLELASAGRDGNLIVWDLARSDRLSRTLPGPVVPATRELSRPDMAVDPERGRIAWTLGDGGLLLGDLDGGQPRELLPPSGTDREFGVTSYRRTLSGLEFSPDGELLTAAVSSGYPVRQRLWFWNAETAGRVEAPVRAAATSASFSPDGGTLAAGGAGRLKVLDTASGDREFGIPRPFRGTAEFSPDGRTIATPVGLEGDVALLRAETGDRVGTLTTGELQSVNDLEFSPDGQMLAGGDVGGNVVLWEVEGGGPPDPADKAEPARPPFSTGHEGTVEDLAFSPDGSLLASSNTFSRLHLWDIDLHRPLGPSLDGAAPVFADGGDVLAAVSPDGGVLLRDMDLGAWREIACGLANRNLGQEEWERFLGDVRDYEPTCPGLPRGRPAEPEFSAVGE